MTMIERYIILFTSHKCDPCEKELRNLAKFKKLRAFPKEENRFIIVNILDVEHSMWVELFRPMTTPEIKIIDIKDLKVEATFSGVGCVNAAWSYLDIPIQGSSPQKTGLKLNRSFPPEQKPPRREEPPNIQEEPEQSIGNAEHSTENIDPENLEKAAEAAEIAEKERQASNSSS